MKNKTEVSRTDVCVRVVKGALEGGGGVMAEKMEKFPPSPASPPPLSPSTQTKIKCESPTVFLGTHTPPPSGPGAEIKGKPGNPIASGSARPQALSRPNSAGGEEGKAVPASAGGGRLTFFKEGKFVLELSHRTDMGAPAGWVPVKSKTYWPPPSSTTTTTTQHPLRHDTPTSQSVSDDCSSLNSSPWTSDHIRKQQQPSRGLSTPPLAAPFLFCCPPKARILRRRVTGGWRRRNPLLRPPLKELAAKFEENKVEGVENKCVKKERVEGESSQGRGAARVEKWVRALWVKAGVRVDADTTLQSLFEQRGSSSSSSSGAGEAVDPTFVSPRKRYLRQMETDQDTPSVLHRKKLHAAGLPQGLGDRGVGVPQVSSASSSSSSSSSSSLPLSVSAPQRSAMNAFPPSVYSIESILNHEGAGASAGAGAGTGTSRLRTLLKPEVKPSPARPRERPPDPPPPAPVKAEREQAGLTGPERGDPLLDLNRPSPDRYDLSRYGPVPSLYHLAPYVDPRYMMLHSLAPGLVAPTNPPEVAQALAAATAAAAAAAGLGTYPLGPLAPPLPGAQYYYPPTSVAAQMLRQPALSSRCSPHPPASPSPKTHYPPPTPASPHLSRGASPRGRASPWQPPPPPAHPLSPHPSLASPLPSPPPQDAPLNLSKPRSHLGK